MGYNVAVDGPAGEEYHRQAGGRKKRVYLC